MKKQCAASLPNADGDEDYYRCDLARGHTASHTDGERSWQDGDFVEVTTVREVRAVPDHQHDFVGDEDTCVRDRNCTITYGQAVGLRRTWDASQED